MILYHCYICKEQNKIIIILTNIIKYEVDDVKSYTVNHSCAVIHCPPYIVSLAGSYHLN